MHPGLVMLGAGGHVAGWPMPGAEFGSENVPLRRRLARTAERGRLDFLFLADALNTGLGAHPGMTVRLEPLTLLVALAMGTERTGLGATVSTTYSKPCNVVHGTPEMVADGLEAWFRAGAADGFVVSCPFYPAPFERFVDQVVPFLVRRGLFRAEYAGRTLRDHLGLSRPPARAGGPGIHAS